MTDTIDKNLASDLYRAFGKGLSAWTISATYGVPLEEVEAVIRRGLDLRPAFGEVDPMEVVRVYELRLEALIEDLVIDASKSKSAKDRIAATRIRQKVLALQFELHRDLGQVPRNLRFANVEKEFEEMLEKFSVIIRRHELDASVLEEFAAAVSRKKGDGR